MKKTKNFTAKIFAAIALLAIIVGIIGSGTLLIISSLGSNNQEAELTQEQIQELLENIETQTGSEIEISE